MTKPHFHVLNKRRDAWPVEQWVEHTQHAFCVDISLLPTASYCVVSWILWTQDAVFGKCILHTGRKFVAGCSNIHLLFTSLVRSKIGNDEDKRPGIPDYYGFEINLQPETLKTLKTLRLT